MCEFYIAGPIWNIWKRGDTRKKAQGEVKMGCSCAFKYSRGSLYHLGSFRGNIAGETPDNEEN